MSAAARIPSAKRTVARACRTQYSGDAISGSPTVPLSIETRPIAGCLNVSVRNTAANSSSIGSINGEWNA